MKQLYTFFCVALLSLSLAINAFSQGDVRSATGMPIPIGTPVIWGQVELKGLKPGEQRPTIYVTLLFNGAQIGRSLANDRGFYYFTQRARDGATLLVTVGGIDVGSQNITAAGGERYDMAVNWDPSFNDSKPGVVSAKDAYPSRKPENAALMEKASAAAKAKNTDEAIKLYNQIVANDSKDFVAWTEVGTLYFGKSDYSKAESAYNKALEQKPDFMLALLNLGKLQIAQKKFAEAVPVLEKATTTDNNSPDAFHYLGEAYLQNKQGSKAVVALNEAIRLAPVEKAEIHIRLATLYNAAGLKDRAANEYKLFLEKKPDHPEKAKLEAYIKENGKS